MSEEASRTYDVIHIGQYYCDLIFTGLADMPQLGAEVFGTGLQLGPGGAFNTSYALYRLGLKTGWICDFGQDFFSQYVLEKVRQLGMDTSLFRFHQHDVCAVTAAFSNSHDRGFISYLDHFEPMDLVPFVETYRPKCVLLGGLCFGDDFIELAKTAHGLDVLMVMDCQYRDVDLDTPGVKEALQQVDVFLPNLSEALRLTGKETAEEALQVLAQVTPLIAIKLGAEGAVAFSNGETIKVPGIHIDEVVDTTGAGDCFNAGFLYGYLRGDPLATCLKYANVCGGASVRGHGVSQIPTEDQLDNLLASYDELVKGNPHLIPCQTHFGLTYSCKK